MQNPHHSQPEVRRIASKTGAGPLGAKKFAQHRPSRGSSAKKLAQQAQKHRIWGVVSAWGELFRACRRRPSSARPISDQAPLVRRAPEGSEGPGRSAREQRQGAAIARQLARGPRQSTTLFAQQQPRRATSGQNSPSTSRTAPLPVQNSPSKSHTAPLPVQNSPSSPEMAQFGAL